MNSATKPDAIGPKTWIGVENPSMATVYDWMTRIGGSLRRPILSHCDIQFCDLCPDQWTENSQSPAGPKV